MLISPNAEKEIISQVIFGHPASGDSTTFLSEAEELAEFGVQSYLVSFPFDHSSDDPANLGKPDREVDFRKKCLWAVEKVIPSLSQTLPLMYVGKNFGAFIGGLAASHENRITHFILAAGLPDLTDFYVSSDHPVAVSAREKISPKQLELYQRKTLFWNPSQRLPRSVRSLPTDIFFQFGAKDPWISEDTAHQFIQAAQGKKRFQFYPDSHDLDHPQARLDRRRYILENSLTSREATERPLLPENSITGRVLDTKSDFHTTSTY